MERGRERDDAHPAAGTHLQRLSGKRILLVSPQAWNHIAVSKHHYAIELARRGNDVYFLEPPVVGLGNTVTVEPVASTPGLALVRYSLRHPAFLRFHARPLFDVLIRRDISRIRKAIGAQLDVVWNFDLNLFDDLRAFDAPLKIYHPVDAIGHPRQVAAALTADVVFTVSDRVLASMRAIGVAAYFVNHGLSEEFARFARKPLRRDDNTKRRLRVGYVGNLLHPSIDHEAFESCIAEAPDADFHIWGPSSARAEEQANAGFVEDLQRRPNVYLYGSTGTTTLGHAIQTIDVFLLAYRADTPLYDSSNSHKILEYLSTGRTVVGSAVSAYANRPDLMLMSSERTNNPLPALLRNALDNIGEHNSSESSARRRRFALEHTYAAQLDRIEAHLGGHALIRLPKSETSA